MSRRRPSANRSPKLSQRSATTPLAGQPQSEPTAWLSARVANTIVAVTIATVAAILGARMGDPIGVRPDSWSEAEVIISGLGYMASGFFAYAGLPQHQIGPPVDPYFLYANYPVLSNVLYGVLHKLGADAYGLYRLPAILASLTAVWLWYRLVTRIVDRATGVAAAVALATSFGFLSYADNIHQLAYPLAPQLGALLCLVIALAPETQHRRKWLIGCALCLLLVGLLTVELHAWLMIALFGYAALFRPSVRRRWLVLLLLPLCAGLALQWFQSWAGSPVPPEDRPGFVQNLYRRSIGFAEATDTPRDATGQKVSLATYPGFIAARFGAFYLLPVWLVPPLMLLGFVGTETQRWPPARWPPQVKLLLIVLVAALGWMGTMMQQTAVHEATMRQLLPFLALLFGVVWTQSARVALDARRPMAWRVFLPLVGLALLIPHGTATWSNMRMHVDHQYRHPVLKEPGWQETLELSILHLLPEGTVILTNHNRVPPLIRYWSRRPTYLAPYKISASPSVQRSWIELTVSHLRGLYQGAPPRMLYLYRIVTPTPQGIRAALADDALLRALTTGHFGPLTSAEAQRQAFLALKGDVPAACPILARGSNWWCFDMMPITPELRGFFSSFPIPKLKDMPAPR